MTYSDTIAALLAAGDTQQVIAEATGISQATISRLHDGSRTEVLASTARRLDQYAAIRLKRKAGRSRR